MPTWLSACPTSGPTADLGANGAIPEERLCELPADGMRLRRDAAAAWSDLADRYAEALGEPMCITDAYRDLATQEQLYATKPGLAAPPGSSNHGWGLALDLCGGAESAGTTENAWLVDNADRFGWVNPDWAQPTGSRPEPWHWEFIG